MNSTLEATLRQADGRYFNDAELQPLEGYVQTYALRLETYSLLGEQSEKLVLQTLRKLAQTDRHTIQEHGEKCKRDMSYVVRSIAIAILKDDEDAFNQQVVLWMQNIMTALHKESQSARAYRLLTEVVAENFPAANAKLVNDNLETFITALTAGA
jgi:mannitol-1-phosphate/altronate dehydrogenase